ncbi:hypothetical protein B0H16DRAFT_1879675 [Mycena metata]|uniref:F-box domain-containing protein n=1 Tax=Mycena metata TaxID=1033252 RepID=A0AAD7K455_9AGAR|nr:hypothetical protein B0H16DRAFT_1879675 [Mycena metata]
MSLQVDADLVQVHQAKVDARLLDIDQSLGRLADLKALAEREEEDLSERIATIDLQRDSFLAPDHVKSLDDARFPLASARERCVYLQQEYDSQRAPLLRERAALEEPILLPKFSAAPMRRVPTEMLLEIFAAVQSSDNAGTSSPQPSGIQEPRRVGQGPIVLLSQVCAEWRAIVCGCPAFWSSFAFPLFSQTNVIGLVAIYLQRAKSAPLTVQLDLFQSQEDDGSTGVPAITLLAQHSQSLVDFRFVPPWGLGARGHFMYYGRDIRLPRLSPFHGNLPRLEVLSLPAWAADSFRAFTSAPQLHTLKLLGDDHQPHQGFFRDQIQSILLHNPDGPTVSWYRNLTHLTCYQELDSAGQMFIPQLQIPPAVTLPHLTSWQIEFRGMAGKTSNFGPLHLFHRFATPNLRRLSISFLNHPAEFIQWLRRAIDDPTFHLTTLILKDCVIRISDLLSILGCTTRLESLAIVGGYSTLITNRLFNFLSVSEDRPNNLAILSTLTISGSFIFQNSALVEMLESRTARQAAKGSCVCLKDVFLSLPDRAVEEDVVRRLRQLDGIKLYLQCLDGSKIMQRRL